MHPRNSTLTAERLRHLLDYDPATGLFTRRFPRGGQPTGCVVGTLNPDGTIRIGVDGDIYLANRLAWLHYHGKWPDNLVDHIDHDRANNRILNLRDVTNAVNMQNQIVAHNKTGLPLGVYKSKLRFVAMIRINKKLKHVGSFKTPEEAHEAYLRAKREWHEGCTL